MPQIPHNLLEEIICDADLFHLGTEDFKECNKLVRKEIMLQQCKDISKSQWREMNIKLLQFHQYFTDYGKQYLAPKKQENLQFLLEKHEADIAAKVSENEKIKINNNNKNSSKKNKSSSEIRETTIEKTLKNKTEKPEKGVETMFRITSTNNQRLSDMADKKADILITVNSILISAILSLLLRKLDSNTHLIIPTMIILTVSVVTMIFAILATRPKIPNGTFTQNDVNDKKVNLLFFGNFYNMNLNEYSNAMKTMMDDRDFLYGSLIKDVYSQGIVLGRKYKLLRTSYNIFMFGIIISVIAFVLSIFPAIS